MIEIIIGHVEMPGIYERRFQKTAKGVNGRIWNVFDSEQENKIVFTGKFKDAALVVHNLNKKHYKDNPIN